jgi:purine nucleoside phosphorylase
VNYLFERTELHPTIGIICGSGLGGLADMLEKREFFPYNKIPAFPVSTGTCNINLLGSFTGYLLVPEYNSRSYSSHSNLRRGSPQCPFWSSFHPTTLCDP